MRTSRTAKEWLCATAAGTRRPPAMFVGGAVCPWAAMPRAQARGIVVAVVRARSR